MAITLTNSASASMLTALVTAIDSGAGSALCVVYSGTPPASAEAVLSGNTVLANVALSDPSATVSGKTLSFSGMPRSDVSADASGTATFFRIHISADGTTPGTAVIQGNCGTSGTDMVLASTALVSGASFSISSASITLP